MADSFSEEAGYPAHRTADVALRDGSTIHVRPVRHSDETAIAELLGALSEESRYLRFFSGGANLDRVVREAVQVDHRNRIGLVAVGSEGRIVAHAMAIRSGDHRAEVAFEVADDYAGRGLATILLAHLAELAHGVGITVFEASVLPANHKMIDVFRQSGFAIEMRSEPGAIEVEFPASLTRDAIERFESREQTAAVAAMRSFLSPRSVAVIGAGRTRGTIGGEIFHNLLEAGFKGPVLPVNPKADVVQSVMAYPTVTGIPDPVDLAVIVVPASAVVDAARECAAKGVRSLVVISSGFAETGGEGTSRQRELLQVCRAAGMRLIGPNCMGILNTAPDVGLNATFAPTFPPPGRVGFLSQSGALGLAVIDYASQLGLGLSTFVSVGNKADISGNDLIHYWESDDGTDLILLYLESFGNPQKFSRIARRVGKTKPIVAVKSGRSGAGARATSSHTGAMLAASDVTVDALFRQAGVIRTDTLAEMFDVAALLANQPPPSGPNVAILTNAGGPGILCADTCEANGLTVPPPSTHVREALASFLPAEAALGNPIDMIASASADDYRRAIEALASEESTDAIIVIFIPPLVTRAEDVAQAIRESAASLPRPIPVLSVFMQARGVPDALRGKDVRIPSYAFPEDAARALARVTAYGVWRQQPEGHVPGFADARPDEAAGLISSALQDGPRWLKPDEVVSLLSCYGVPFAETRVVPSAAAAGRAAKDLGERVALKAVGPLHKTDVGAVELGLRGASAVEAAATRMRRRLRARREPVDGFLVQRMVPAGVEMLVGVVHDKVFGPVVACGAGGTAVELLKDVQVRITPLSDRDADEMVRSLSTFPLLDGYRGAQKADVAALEDVLLRVAALVETHPEIAEMDCNPVVVLQDGAVVVDARIRVEAAPAPLPLSARRPV